MKTQKKKPKLTFDSIKNELNANHIYKRNQIKWFTQFSRFGYFDVYESNSITREYVFFTKPDLRLFVGDKLNPELASYPFFINACNTHINSMYQLQYSIRNKTEYSPFCNLLSNAIDSRVDLSDISIEKLESSTNIYGNKLEYPLAVTTSNNLQDITIEFEDNKFLDVYMVFRIWYEYELLKARGLVTPDKFYIVNKILHDQMSIYKFIVGEDGETIIHWSKFWGVYPTSIPRSTFSDLQDGPIKFSIPFTCQWVEDMEPTILSDFNILVKDLKKRNPYNIPIYDDTIGKVSGKWCSVPYILKNTLHGRNVYKLKWGGSKK